VCKFRKNLFDVGDVPESRHVLGIASGRAPEDPMTTCEPNNVPVENRNPPGGLAIPSLPSNRPSFRRRLQS
jgi:hypothetical protein